MAKITIEELNEKFNELFTKQVALEQRLNQIESNNKYEGVYLDGVNSYNRDYIAQQMTKERGK